ncbi:hypothetical protein AB0M47_38835 [Hamadaea sp. NPDC051192]|uniref:hypothetical protein n=1 Tax=Hamadaea sp. NPDC051192 TaxID=3154940 RepID=UPI0034368352
MGKEDSGGSGGRRVIGGRVLDASTLVDFALERPYPHALVWTAVDHGIVLAVPAAALATAWASLPTTAYDALGVLLDLPDTIIEALDAKTAREVGRLLAGVDADAVRAGQVVGSGIRRGWPIVTADASALRAVDPRAEIDELP